MFKQWFLDSYTPDKHEIWHTCSSMYPLEPLQVLSKSKFRKLVIPLVFESTFSRGKFMHSIENFRYLSALFLRLVLARQAWNLAYMFLNVPSSIPPSLIEIQVREVSYSPCVRIDIFERKIHALDRKFSLFFGSLPAPCACSIGMKFGWYSPLVVV